MSKSNLDICHDFFYNDRREYCPYYKNVGYKDNLFYSYYTVIGQIENTINNEEVLLLSYWTMSVSTATHIKYLRQASPLKIIYAPFEYGEHYHIEPKTLAARCLEYLERYAKSKLSQKANRQEFFSFYNMLTELNENFKTGVKMPKKFIELFAILNDSEQVKKFKIRQAELERKQAEKARRALNKLLKNNNIAELARQAYSYESKLDAEVKNSIKNALNPKGDLSFVWRDDAGDFKTSQSITLSKTQGETALKAWRAGKLKHGEKIGYYTVLEVAAEFVKIGCHKIPVANLEVL